MADRDALVRELAKFSNWAESAARYVVRANFSCEYCGLDLLASVDNFKQWENDHIVPASAGGTDDDSNIAVSCRTCNWHLKRGWDPSSECGSNAEREELVDAVREYVRKRRTRFLRELVEVRETIDNIGRKTSP